VAGTGIAGLSLAIWSKLAGAACVVVLGRRKARLDLACELAADCGVNVREENDPADKVLELVGPADFFFEAVGRSDQIRLGLSLLRPDGTVAVYGVPEKPYELEYGWLPHGNVDFRAPEAHEYVTYDWALDVVRRGIVPAEKLMTHRWPMDDFNEAIEEIEAGEVVKGMIEM
jgi:threonine dehydrogenase-like Zn-dependent dehydrogenase